MLIKKFDFDYGRRKMMQNIALGVGAGVLLPLGKVIAKDMDLSKAYPDELLSVEMQTKGKLKPGDYITKDNVESAKHLLDPSVYDQIVNEGRRIKIRAPTTDMRKLFNNSYYQAMQENLASNRTGKFGADGNVYDDAGKPWGGGLPFSNPKDGKEVWCNMAMSWGRADANCYAVQQWDYGSTGKLEYRYDFQWVELQMQARTDKKVFRNMTNEIRRQAVFFASSQDVRGTSFLSNWAYDQRKIPDLYGYLPEFRRVRQFPANQRFEPLIPGSTWFLTDPWAAGDPFLTWGNHKIIERKPMLGAFGGNFAHTDDNWQPPEQKNNPKFWESEFEMSPEVIVAECEPTGYPRSPVSRKRAYVDARNSVPFGCMRYDRQGKLWANFEMAFGQKVGGGKNGNRVILSADGKTPAWSWTYVMIYDHQNRRMSRTHQARTGTGIESRFQVDENWLFDTYCTQQALQSLGRA
ncbi:DUF1329 domain-containing protein [Hydrocarboniphaga sp.]|jgi:hypothetical protein|uniref:DUF1329 domain-containing protein n=1 Tax=Hydrocarboniphaga sp. TaxID=2033016 RepID=UPI002AB902FA|nr:DUF1329 domain-containing protein [Hydrocarboniphaga sp.]MDZ4078441.1 DUF1329 domain-containing protein [Hydrocarboniphaga sp.]